MWPLASVCGCGFIRTQLPDRLTLPLPIFVNGDCMDMYMLICTCVQWGRLKHLNAICSSKCPHTFSHFIYILWQCGCKKLHICAARICAVEKRSFSAVCWVENLEMDLVGSGEKFNSTPDLELITLIDSSLCTHTHTVNAVNHSAGLPT